MLDRQRLRTFVLGGIAGALAGVLLTPRSGKEIRGSIRERAGEARERGRETYFDAQERMQERVSRRTREGRAGPGDPFSEGTVEGLPTLGLAGPEQGFGPEPVGGEPVAGEPFVGVPAEAPGPPPLRDVSQDESGEHPGPDTPDAEELRRRIREIRSRLHRQPPQEQPPGPGGPGEGHDE